MKDSDKSKAQLIEELAELRKSEARFRAVAESTSDAIIVTDHNGVIIYWNEASCNIYGYAKEEITGRSIDVLLCEPEIASKADAFATYDEIRNAPVFGNVKRSYARRKDGGVFPVEVTLSSWESGDRFYFCSIVRDISEKVLAEAQLQKKSHDLVERVKELNLLYSIAGLIETKRGGPEEVFQGIVDLIPLSWQYPDHTCVRMTLEANVYQTADFSPSSWQQSAEITVDGKMVGKIEVYRRAEKSGDDEGPFLVEEQKLLELIAAQVGRILGRMRVEQEVKSLSGLLPICASCKKIRDDEGYWKKLESYIKDHSEADFTHSICPECAEKLYPGLYGKKKSGKNSD